MQSMGVQTLVQSEGVGLMEGPVVQADGATRAAAGLDERFHVQALVQSRGVGLMEGPVVQAGEAKVVVEAATEEPQEESDVDLKAPAVLVSGRAEEVAELRRRQRAVLLLHPTWRGLLMKIPVRVWERVQMKK